MAHAEHATSDLIACRQAIYAQPGFRQAMTNAMMLQEMEVRIRNLMRPEDYGRIQTPMLVLFTSHDPTADVVEGRRMAGMITDARFVVVDNCGHWPQSEDVETFDSIHVDFLLGRALAAS